MEGEGNAKESEERLQKFAEYKMMKSKKPSKNRFKQQNYDAWFPQFTAGSMFPIFFVVGILFIPIGVGLYFISDNMIEIKIPYTDCVNIDNRSEKCEDNIQGVPAETRNCTCEVPFEIKEAIEGKVNMYYYLENFYQNNRRYVTSRDDYQLKGEVFKDGKPVIGASACGEKDDSELRIIGERFVVPCGAIANSMFSDTIDLYYKIPKDGTDFKVPLIRKGIAWETDKQYKFKNPPELFNDTLWTDKFIKPKDWKKDLRYLDEEDDENTGLQNEDFIVWMRVAAFPNFRKLYRFINHTSYFKDELPAGNYTLHIDYVFDVKSFNGTKAIILAKESIIGSKNSFLGFAYFIVGVVSVAFAVLFLFIHVKQRLSISKTRF